MRCGADDASLSLILRGAPHPNVCDLLDRATVRDTVVIMTPMRNREQALSRYFDNIAKLNYPK